MEETKEIIGDEVVITSKVDLASFIKEKKEELDEIDRRAKFDQERKAEILKELEALL